MLPFSKAAFPLLTALLLAACGPAAPTSQLPATTPTTPVTAPATTPVSAAGKVYEINFANVDGSGKVSSSARYIPAGVGTQALTDVTGPLSLTPLASDTFVVGGVRHIKAVYRVTNNTGQAIDHLTFVPVNTDDADGDPTNNTTTPTVGATYFKALRTYGNTSADTRATALTPTTGQLLNTSTGAAEPDTNATPYSTVNTSGLNVSAPSGLTVGGVADSGWRSGNLLQPGASTTVTFAVDLATDTPQTDPFAFSVVITVADDIDTTPITQIHDIQGSGAATTLSGSVTTQGVVVGDFQRADQLKGFFIEAPDAAQDADPATSEGIFVFCDETCQNVNVGDTVRVTGTVTEFNTITEISPTTAVQVRGTNTLLPTATAVNLPTDAASASTFDWERYEGMRVRVQGVVDENYKLGRGGVVKIANARLPSFTQVNAPSVSGYAAWVAEIGKRLISIDDGSTAQNPATVFGRGNAPLSASNTLRTGDTADVTGVVHYGFDYTGTPDTYRIETTLPDATFAAGNPRPSAPALSGNLTVASANVLNFFTTLTGGTNTCTPDGADADARGADNCAEYVRQRDKVVSNLAGLNADVIGLMEVQNNSYSAITSSTGSTLQTLVDALNARVGAGTYTAIANPNTGTDAITVAMIYKAASVTPIGNAFNDTDPVNNRLPLAQVFQAPGGSKFAVVVNHLKSKGSPADSDPRNVDNSDGQGASAYRREQQVARLLDLIQNQIVVGKGVNNVIAVGDFNAYAQEPSLKNLQNGLDGTAGTADDLSPVFPDTSYSYQFDAQFGSLDHAFVTQSMKALLSGGEGTGFQKWHDNSDEPTVLDYNTEFKSAAQVTDFYDSTAYRSSDHDPLKVGFNMPALTTLGVTASGSATPATGQPYTLTLSTTGNPDSASIDWGDGTAPSNVAVVSNAASAPHTYTTDGPRTITVTVTRSADSSTASTTKNVTATTPSITRTAQSADPSVQVGQSTSVTATFAIVNAAPVTYSAAVSPNTGGVTVNAIPSNATDGTPTITATLNGVTAGTYTVTLTANGQNGASASAVYTVTVTPAATSVNHLVISQVYGGGGNNGATYKNDFVELFNPTAAPISTSGYTLQYASATGVFNTGLGMMTLPAATIPAYSYYLIQLAAGGAGTVSLTPDATGTLSLSGTVGKVALASNNAVVNSPTAANVVDFVGFGSTASQFEGSAPTAAPSNTTAVLRAGNGCTDTNSNVNDFATGVPNPRNSSAPTNPCP
ncbi:ExeM/NucH family extracellular endonuclease [Deinococcus sp. KNUC1210]|uniref:ExeM/NucH family extracellular endonuclease n=1 Tax=Deinococcus sp. KNUC1210 TaxID=2917691 RepID=UPI001EF0E97D|nr:ExeM/NucH family extracellular endonuclease [Deinococcus sp. KNUC1210]ULH16062.1 ExeM/NucH family extracellular endonuclease [Deinococcus sp. KNUC1210]